MGSGEKVSSSSQGNVSKSGWKTWLAFCGAVLILWLVYPSGGGENSASNGQRDKADVQAVTWNMAAINNNPFEYWITHDDKTYNKLMEDVSAFINDPGARDVEVQEVFTDAMYDDLEQEMNRAGWQGLAEVRQWWETEYKHRKIISEFIKDPVIGKKRLASMPDRYTNTINTVDGSTVMRPTVINCFEGDLSSIPQWWLEWKKFVFHTSVTVQGRNGVSTKAVKDMLSPIRHAKYPAITLKEEAVSIPLQTMAGAVFDAILVHMLNELAPGKWESLRSDMCEKLNKKKNHRTVEILETTYRGVDIQFLQEVAGQFISVANANTLGSKLFDVHYPAALDGDRDQNSLILLKKGTFTDVKEVTDEIKDHYASTFNEPLGISAGDLFAMTCRRKSDGTPFLLASFHGDTNGLLTIPTVKAVSSFAASALSDHKLLFGMDANTYEGPKSDQQGVVAFAQFYTAAGLNSCYGPNPNPKNYTTFHARTYLQPQLNKAIRFTEKDDKGDKNPKDFIVFFNKDFKVLATRKDNTGRGKYVEGMVFPTLAFPSDHGITWTSLAKGASSVVPVLRGRS